MYYNQDMKVWLPFFLSLVWFFANVATLSHYGINWDAPMQMMRGQAFAQLFLDGTYTYDVPQRPPSMLIGPDEFASRYYFLPAERGKRVTRSGDPSVQETHRNIMEQRAKRISFYRDPTWNSAYFVNNDGAGHMPLVDILSAFSNRLLYEHFGVFGDIESYQLLYLLGSAIGVFIVTRFAIDITGSLFSGLVAGLSLGMFPLFIAESHINMKDPWQASMVVGFVWALWRYGETRRTRWFVGLVLFLSLALGVKWNIGIFPVPLALWLGTLWKRGKLGRWDARRLIFLSGLALLGIVGFLAAIWPYAWSDPVTKIASVASFYLEHGFDSVRLQPPGYVVAGGFNIFPWVSFLTQTPVIILLLVGMAMAGLVRRQVSNPVNIRALLLLWILVPLIRVSLPHASYYGGLRQVMEIVPLLAVLVGIGVSDVLTMLPRTWRSMGRVIILAVYAPLVYLVLQYHPYENAFFNVLAGGIAGAAKRNLIDWTLSWGSVYKQGAEWMNRNAESGARIAHLDGTMFAISPLWLRDDVTVSADYFSGMEQKGEYILSLANPLSPPVFAKRYVDRYLVPVHSIDVGGVPILFIYKNEAMFSKRIQEAVLSPGMFKVGKGRLSNGASFWQVDLRGEYTVSRVEVEGAPSSCALGFASNEFVSFASRAQKGQPVDGSHTFVFHEKRLEADGSMTYFFPGEPARFMYIYPQNPDSCFERGRIRNIWYVHPGSE